MEIVSVEIKHHPQGYYTLYVNGRFGGNFDTYGEAQREYEEEYESEGSAPLSLSEKEERP